MFETHPPLAGLEPFDEARQLERFTRGFRAGANWFFWIAGLSLLNSLIHASQGTWSFVVGLGVTQILDVTANEIAKGRPDVGGFVRVIALLWSACAAAFGVFIGWQARRRRRWAFVLGMVLYALDGLIIVLVGDWLSVAFHAFALFCIWSGFKMLAKLEDLERDLQSRATTQPAAP